MPPLAEMTDRPSRARRSFLRALATLAPPVFTPAWLSACGGSSGATPPTPSTGAPAPPVPAPPVDSRLALRYDPTRADVVLARALTSPPQPTPSSANESGSYTGNLVVPGTGGFDFDAVLGLQSTGSAYSVLLGVSQSAALDGEGQCYFEVERAYAAARPDQSLGSTGRPIAVEDYPVSVARDAPGQAGAAIAVTIDSTKAIDVSDSLGNSGGHFNDLALASTQTHVPVTAYWRGPAFGILVNGRRLGQEIVRGASVPGIAHNVQLAPATGGRIRNLMLVSQAPQFRPLPNPAYARFCIFGDSYSTAGSDPEGSGAYDAAITVQVETMLAQAGYRLDWPYANSADASAQTFPGHAVMGYSTAAPPLDLAASPEPPSSSASQLWDKLDRTLALEPTVLLMQAGVNDWFNATMGGFGHMDGPRFERWLRRYVQRILGLDTSGYGAYPSTTVRKLLIATTPYAPDAGGTNGQPAGPDVQVARAIDAQTDRSAKLAVVDWFNATYPQRAGAVQIVPVFETLGATAADPALFNSAAGDYLHPNNRGTALMGRTYGEAILSESG
jgi:hypothetical protein